MRQAGRQAAGRHAGSRHAGADRKLDETVPSAPFVVPPVSVSPFGKTVIGSFPLTSDRLIIFFCVVRVCAYGNVLV